MGSQMGSQNTCISSTSGCLFGTRFCTYFGTVLGFLVTSRWLNWILLRRLLQTHLVASKDPKYVAKPRALARVDIYKGDLGRLHLTSYSYSYSHPPRGRRDPRSGYPSQDRPQVRTHPRTRPPRSGYPSNWHSQTEPPHEVVVYSREQRYLKPRLAGNRAHGRPLGMTGWTSPCTSGPDRPGDRLGPTYGGSIGPRVWRIPPIHPGFLLPALPAASRPNATNGRAPRSVGE